MKTLTLFLAAVALRFADRAFGRLAINTSIDTEGPVVTRLADATHTDFILVKRGSTAATGYAVCGASDQPFGVVLDTVATGQTGQGRAVRMLGLGDKTVPVRVSEASTIGALAVTATSGEVQSGVPATAGTYWIVGIHTKAQGTASALGEILPCRPQKLVVVANASTLSQTQAAMVNGAIVEVLGA